MVVNLTMQASIFFPHNLFHDAMVLNNELYSTKESVSVSLFIRFSSNQFQFQNKNINAEIELETFSLSLKVGSIW